MGHTIAEKILASHAGVESATPGEILRCHPDLIMSHDLTAPHAISVFKDIGVSKIHDPGKLVFVQDHFQPAKDVLSAGLAKSMREFARGNGITHYYEVGRGGICHSLMLENGLILPGMLVAGADSHTTSMGAVGALGYGVGATDLAALWALGELWLAVPVSRKYILNGRPQRFVGGKDIILKLLGMIGQEGAMHQAVEFEGSAFQYLSISDRITIANMTAEIGAATSIIQQDEITTKWLAERTSESGTVVTADPDAEYVKIDEIDISSLGPLVAIPDEPSNVHPVEEVTDVQVDQVFLGSCANGHIEDLRRFISVLGDNKFNRSTRVIVIPSTQGTYRQALEEGILTRILDAGGAVQTPGCGPCLGGFGGVLAAGEVCLSTTNRNFKGRMGHPDSKVYIASPEVAAATAVMGRITHPSETAPDK